MVGGSSEHSHTVTNDDRPRRVLRLLGSATVYRYSLAGVAAASVGIIVLALLGYTDATIVITRVLLAYLCVVLLARHLTHGDVGR